MTPHLLLALSSTDCVPSLMTRVQLLVLAAMQPESMTDKESLAILREFRALKQLVS